MKKRFTEQQIAFALRQAESGTPISEIIRKMGVTEQTYYHWRKDYGGMRMDQAKRLKELEKENAQLKKLVADRSLDIEILQETLRGNY